jgi:hypothetical protein
LQDQFDKHIDELKLDAKQVSKLVSDTVRTVNFGLAALLLVYKSGQLGAAKFDPFEIKCIVLASAFGVLGILADVLQNIASLLHSQNKLKKAEGIQKSGEQVSSRDQFMTLKTDFLPKVRSCLFWLKIGFTVLGSTLLAINILGWLK